MKRFFITAILLLALVQVSRGQPASFYIISSLVTTPPQVDATNFVNNGELELTLSQVSPFGFFDVQYYTNNGVMTCNTGFLFDDSPSIGGSDFASANFFNGSLRSILVDSITNGGPSSSEALGQQFSIELLQVWATNVVNHGILDVGPYGVISITGNTIKLANSTLHVEGFDDSINSGLTGVGISSEFWGVGTQTNLLSLTDFQLPDPTSPSTKVTTTTGSGTTIIEPTEAAAYAVTNSVNTSNFTFQAVFVNTNLSGISTTVLFEPGSGAFAIPVIQWQAVVTNVSNQGVQTVITNSLYLTDTLGAIKGNPSLLTNNYTSGGTAELAPTNYTLSRSFSGFNSLSPPNSVPYNPSNLFASAFGATNVYTAYEVELTPVTAAPDPSLPDSIIQNSPGRIELNAATSLDVTGTKLTGANYINFNSPNHFAGSTGAIVDAPFLDLNLGSTNGTLAITNLVSSSVSRFNGTISMYSARWTNITALPGGTNGFYTNAYHVLIVDAEFTPSTPPEVISCQLRSTNVFISDVLDIVSNLQINATSLTVTSNGPNAATPIGEIDLETGGTLSSSNFPGLQNLTNFGYIIAGEDAIFYTNSNPNSTPNGLFSSFVNHGIIEALSISVGANYLENSGLDAYLYAYEGGLSLQAGTGVLTNSELYTATGDIAISAGNLTIMNETVQSSGALNFTLTNNLNDGGVNSGNFWYTSYGMNLFQKPATGDFLGSTFDLQVPAGGQVPVVWAGLDKGPVESGFTNNGAVGHLIVDGGDTSSMLLFSGPDSVTNYAIYVDQLELLDGAVNRGNVGGNEVFTALNVAPNFKIYFADAVIGGNDISEKLNGSNNGQLVWVPSYAGIFSSTNLVYPAGVTNTFNRALVESTDIDSNGNGVANAFDPMPIYTSYDVNLVVSLTNLPPRVPVLTWSGLANSTNIVYYRTNLSNPGWLVLTNFVYGPANGVATVVDRARTNGPAFYKVQVIAALP